MKKLICSLVLVSAGCAAPAADLTPVTAELAALRKDLDEIKQGQQPTFDREQVLADLTREVRRLQDRPSAAPAAPAALAIPAAPAGSLVGAVGGSQAGLNDLFWVLAKVSVDNQERIVLALYKVTSQGFKLASVRMLGADLQIVEYNQERPRVKDALDEILRAKK